MKRSGLQKFFKFLLLTIVGLFFLIGLGLSGAFLAVKFHLTDAPGVVDINDRYFQEIKNKYGKHTKIEASSGEKELYKKIAVLSKYYPENAGYILNAYNTSNNLVEALRMAEAAEIHLKENSSYLNDVAEIQSMTDSGNGLFNTGSIYEWMNISEWRDFKLAVAKDRALIDSAANLAGVEPRLIVSVLVGEQIRLFNSNREAYKRWISPLKVLFVESSFSYGVTGIKLPTAKQIETYLKDSSSVFYLGKEYEKLLDFETGAIANERLTRLTSTKNHFYSYLYAALNIKQMKVQWERMGYPIDHRPEILATLYNIGFESSQPKANPVVGGSGININGKRYSFGSIAYEFYYSGELFDLFPFKKARFDFNSPDTYALNPSSATHDGNGGV
jgi:hypothetical protein